MFDAKCLQALVAVAEEGGFERAARRLRLTQSAVSQRIRLLEEQLGQPVLARTQPPRPTAPGQALLRHARRLGLLEAELALELGGENAEGGPAGDGTGELSWRTLSLAVNADTLATWFAAAVLPVLTEGGCSRRLALDLRVDDQERTHGMLRRGEVAGCVSTRPEAMQGCRVEPLGVMVYHCCAAPEFAARHFPRGLDLPGARRAPAVVFNRDDAVHDTFLQARLGRSPEGAPRHHVPDSWRFVDFVLAGAGYGLIPLLQAGQHLEAGRLADLAPRAPLPVPLYWHCWNVPSRLLDDLGTALRRAARETLA